MPKSNLELDSKALLKIQLQKIVPGLLQKQFTSQIPTSLALSSGLMGARQVMESRAVVTTINEQALLQKLNQINVLNQNQVPLNQTKSIQKSQQAQVQALALETAMITPTTPISVSTMGIPIIPGFPLPLSIGGGWGESKEHLQGKGMGAYIPDFTAKALGLKPKAMSQAQLKRLLKTELTGLEIRRGVVPK
jgi:hypothetical protein